MTTPIDCEAAMRQLWDYLDEELDAPREAAMRRHLAECRDCAGHADFEHTFLGAVRTAQREAPPSRALRSRVLALLAHEGFRARNGEEGGARELHP